MYNRLKKDASKCKMIIYILLFYKVCHVLHCTALCNTISGLRLSTT